METERKHIFSKHDIIAILFLIGCLLVGGILSIYQKSRKKVPPRLLIETVKKTEAGFSRQADAQTYSDFELSVNINTAPADSLELLPGIGPHYAEKIVEFRESNGSFNNIAEITKISGIGTHTFEQIKKYIKVK